MASPAATAQQLQRLYELLDRARAQTGGWRYLYSCEKDGIPARGVYFFFDENEPRSGSGHGPRCVRVGTHAVSAGSKATLWGRLRQHRGAKHGGGNHRGSVFRKLVGHALIERDGLYCATWGKGENTTAELRKQELSIERHVSDYIGSLPLTWVTVDDEPSASSMRSFIERNALALLSAVGQEPPLDRASALWLGASCPAPNVSGSGLWNQLHVSGDVDRNFLDVFESILDGRV